jgi:hypothetical protein
MTLRGRGGDEIKAVSRRRRTLELAQELFLQNEAMVRGKRESYQASFADYERRRQDHETRVSAADRRLEDVAERIAGEKAAVRHTVDRFRQGGPNFPSGFLDKADPARLYRAPLQSILSEAVGEIEKIPQRLSR